MFAKKYVVMDMLPDSWGSYGGSRISTVVDKKEPSLIDQLKQIKYNEKLKEKLVNNFQIKL